MTLATEFVPERVNAPAPAFVKPFDTLRLLEIWAVIPVPTVMAFADVPPVRLIWPPLMT